MKTVLESVKNIFSELLLFFLVVAIVVITVVSITSLWGLTFEETLENDINYVRLDTENSYMEMLREEDAETRMSMSDVVEVVE